MKITLLLQPRNSIHGNKKQINTNTAPDTLIHDLGSSLVRVEGVDAELISTGDAVSIKGEDMALGSITGGELVAFALALWFEALDKLDAQYLQYLASTLFVLLQFEQVIV